MSVNASWLRMFLEMQRRCNFSKGDALALGVQDVMFTHDTAAELIRERKTDFRVLGDSDRSYHLSRNQKQFTSDPRHYMDVKDLFAMLGYSSLTTLDAFENDKPDIQWNLCDQIPESMHNKYDLLFDIGCLEHTADIFQSLENVGNLVKPGGWIILYLPMVSPINTCMYHPNPPFYFDNLAQNGFGNFLSWINWMPDWDQQTDIRTVWLNFQYNDDVYIWRPRYYTVMWFMAQKLEYKKMFKPALQNFYKEWHAGGELLVTSERELMKGIENRPLTGVRSSRILNASAAKSKFAADILQRLNSKIACPWQQPSAQFKPTSLQLTKYPMCELGVPYASEPTVPPIDSRTQADIPEQMLVGPLKREQLYL